MELRKSGTHNRAFPPASTSAATRLRLLLLVCDRVVSSMLLAYTFVSCSFWLFVCYFLFCCLYCHSLYCHSLSESLTVSLTHSLPHLLPNSLIFAFAYSLVPCSLTHSLISSSITHSLAVAASLAHCLTKLLPHPLNTAKSVTQPFGVTFNSVYYLCEVFFYPPPKNMFQQSNNLKC